MHTKRMGKVLAGSDLEALVSLEWRASPGVAWSSDGPIRLPLPARFPQTLELRLRNASAHAVFGFSLTLDEPWAALGLAGLLAHAAVRQLRLPMPPADDEPRLRLALTQLDGGSFALGLRRALAPGADGWVSLRLPLAFPKTRPGPCHDQEQPTPPASVVWSVRSQTLLSDDGTEILRREVWTGERVVLLHKGPVAQSLAAPERVELEEVTPYAVRTLAASSSADLRALSSTSVHAPSRPNLLPDSPLTDADASTANSSPFASDD